MKTAWLICLLVMWVAASHGFHPHHKKKQHSLEKELEELGISAQTPEADMEEILHDDERAASIEGYLLRKEVHLKQQLWVIAGLLLPFFMKSSTNPFLFFYFSFFLSAWCNH
jgi:hypothetical protein